MSIASSSSASPASPASPAAPAAGLAGNAASGTSAQRQHSSGDQPVWDVLVRFFHWSLVLAYVVSWLSSESDSPVHTYSGYFIGGLLITRLFWGLVGSRYARFSSFLFGPRETLAYLRGVLSGRPPHYAGHNPLGALMVFALLLSLSVTVVTGLQLNGDLPGAFTVSADSAVSGRIDADQDDDDEAGSEDASPAQQLAHDRHEQWEDVHEFFAQLSLMLVGLHIAGVLLASIQHRENLARAMLTGRKRRRDGQ